MSTDVTEIYLDQGVLLGFLLDGLVAVAALKVLEHGGNGEGQQEQPDKDGDVRRFLERLQEVLPTGMHHIKVSVDGRDRQEGDAGAAV